MSRKLGSKNVNGNVANPHKRTREYLTQYLKNWRKTKGKEKQDSYVSKYRSNLNQLKIDCVNYKGCKCQNCGYDKCMGALDFHHVDPSNKEDGIAELINRKIYKTLDELKPELDKCSLLCKNCHYEYHFNTGWEANKGGNND
jgi:hypothetical protein